MRVDTDTISGKRIVDVSEWEITMISIAVTLVTLIIGFTIYYTWSLPYRKWDPVPAVTITPPPPTPLSLQKGGIYVFQGDGQTR